MLARLELKLVVGGPRGANQFVASAVGIRRRYLCVANEVDAEHGDHEQGRERCNQGGNFHRGKWVDLRKGDSLGLDSRRADQSGCTGQPVAGPAILSGS